MGSELVQELEWFFVTDLDGIDQTRIEDECFKYSVLVSISHITSLSSELSLDFGNYSNVGVVMTAWDTVDASNISILDLGARLEIVDSFFFLVDTEKTITG